MCREKLKQSETFELGSVASGHAADHILRTESCHRKDEIHISYMFIHDSPIPTTKSHTAIEASNMLQYSMVPKLAKSRLQTKVS